MKTQQQYRCNKEDLTTAIRRKEFIPFFQPKIDLTTGLASCVEMLARWDHPEWGILPPSQFIYLIEREGLIDEFTDNLFRQSLGNAASHSVRSTIGMAINFSSLALERTRTSHRICSLVEEYGFSFEQITIEVTESAPPENLSSVIKTLADLRSKGFQISIDDFGTGYSSMKLLSEIPFTELKIDKMFIAGISDDKKLISILENIVNLAEKLTLSTVAEGIETRTQYDFVRSIGCHFAQGFYVGAPVRDLNAINTIGNSRLAIA